MSTATNAEEGSRGTVEDRGNPDLGKTPEELALEREIAELHAQGREEERGGAADRLAVLRSAKKFGPMPHDCALGRGFAFCPACGHSAYEENR